MQPDLIDLVPVRFPRQSMPQRHRQDTQNRLLLLLLARRGFDGSEASAGLEVVLKVSAGSHRLDYVL